ncbi:MAG: glycosyltransferase [Acidobacteriota bacterium]
MKLLFVGPLWKGSTALQRFKAFQSLPEINVFPLDSMERVGKATLLDRLRHKLRWPADHHNLNHRLLNAMDELHPDAVFIDSVKIFLPATVKSLKLDYRARVVFYSPDDVSAPHNSSRQLEACDRLWDIFFTTKSFNMPELQARGVRQPILIGKSYDAEIHRPWNSTDVGDQFEQFDTVFVGTCEGSRLQSINRLAQAGIKVVVYGNGWDRSKLHSEVTLYNALYAEDYTRALHTGKLALCFLRKLNRDLVTQRSVELPAAARPMLAEKTGEHDQLFIDGSEYISFTNDDELVERAGQLLACDQQRVAIAQAGRERCLRSGYSTVDRAKEMYHAIATIS